MMWRMPPICSNPAIVISRMAPSIVAVVDPGVGTTGARCSCPRFYFLSDRTTACDPHLSGRNRGRVRHLETGNTGSIPKAQRLMDAISSPRRQPG